MASNYFSLISRVVNALKIYCENEDDEDLAKLQRYNLDVKILETFCLCLETCDDDDTADEERKESLRCMITHLKVIWVQQQQQEEEEEEEDNNNLETWPKHINDFDPLTFGLEGKILQSKSLIQEWCQILINFSSSMLIHNIDSMRNISKCLFGNLCHLLVVEIVQFKNEMDILKDMLEIVIDILLFSVHTITDSKELHEYLNFVYAFLNNAVCLTCHCWAKETNDNETEMNTALFHMLQSIKPCAVDVIAYHFAVLKSNGLLQSYNMSAGRIHAFFVDFFYAHTLLKDDFLILRERLILLLTFLTNGNDDAPAQEEEELIRNQIYHLFREDEYLLPLHINEMKEYYSSDMKMLRIDFMNKTDILIAQIIQLYYNTPSSDSWNRLEAERMSNTYFAYVQREMSSFKSLTLSDWYHHPDSQVNLYLTEISFLRLLFFQCFETWDGSDEGTRVRLRSVLTSLQRIWGQENDMGLLSGRLYAIRKGRPEDWDHLLDLELKDKFYKSKQEINAWLISLSHCSFHCRPSTCNKILEFMDFIVYHLCKGNNDVIVTVKKQFETVEEKLLLLKNLLELATNCEDSKDLEEFKMLAQGFANNAACLLYIDWAKEKNKEIRSETNLMISTMLQIIKPNTPDVARTYIGTLKAICLQPCDSFLLEQTATSFVDYFFEDLVTPWKSNFQILRDEVIFHLTFVHHHHHHTSSNAKEIIGSQLDVLFPDGAYDLLPFDDIKWDLSRKNVDLSEFMMNIGIENAKIRQLCCKFPDSFVYNFPKIIGHGFLDCLIHKLINLMERMITDQKFTLHVKYKIMTIGKELIYQILELKALNDALHLEVVNVVYLAEHVISLCFIFYHLISHYIPHLSDVVDKIKSVRTKLEKIQECNMKNARCLPHSADYISTLSKKYQTSEIHEVLVGFEVEEKIIIDNITRGTDSLHIVSIVGMGGLGKTTLAKKVYGSSFVKSHFNKFAFTYVSQDYDKRRVLLDILRDIVGVDVKTSSMSEDDLAHKLKKCLIRTKYFIVLDDIWNINFWDEVRSSFPDNQNGSRVMFTTRDPEIARNGNIQCTPLCLRFLTEDESWKLLQKKVFQNDMPPPNISSVAKLISKKCGGLPLAIVVIAGLLARTETSLWIEISKRVSSYLFDEDEGFLNILEVSYKHLPEYLKPCFLYLGAFPADSSYKVKDMTLLWIDEGFIKESKTKSLNDVAIEYLYELVDRSLVIVDKMIIGEIRTFHVHDLVYDFCQKKCLDSNFFHLGHGTVASSFSAPLKYNHYRVSVQKLYEPSLTNTRSLLCFHPSFRYNLKLLALRKFRFAQVLYLEGIVMQESDVAQVTSHFDLRHIEAKSMNELSIPSSISNLWNMQSLILKNLYTTNSIHLPETFWRMKSLRHVNVHNMRFEVSDELNAYPQLDKVVSFSKPHIFGGKNLEWLLHRLPAVEELKCILHIEPSSDSTIKLDDTFNFYGKLESLKLVSNAGKCNMLINFPLTLIKLTMEGFCLSSTVMSTLAGLQYLRILKLRRIFFRGHAWEMEDLIFPNLKYIEISGGTLKLWNASYDSFPCLEQLFFDHTNLEELPLCFGEISSLKKITIKSSSKLENSALRVQEEHMDFGNKVELEIS